jgi:hypothetical protein
MFTSFPQMGPERPEQIVQRCHNRIEIFIDGGAEDDDDYPAVRRGSQVRGHREPAIGQYAPEHYRGAFLDERHLPAPHHVNGGLVDVDTKHLMSGVGDAQRQPQSDVTRRPDYRHVFMHHVLPTSSCGRKLFALRNVLSDFSTEVPLTLSTSAATRDVVDR